MISLLMMLLIMIACLYYGIIYQDAGMLTVLFAIGILVAISFVELISRVFTMHCNLQVPIVMVDKGQKIRIQIATRNTGILPVGKIRVRLKIKNVLKGDEQRIWHMIPGVRCGRNVYEISWMPEDAGAYEVRLEKITIQGIFGFMSITKRSKAFVLFSVLPQIHSMGMRLNCYNIHRRHTGNLYQKFKSSYSLVSESHIQNFIL